MTYGARTFIVQEMDRNRIARVKIITARPAGGRVRMNQICSKIFARISLDSRIERVRDFA